MTKELLVKEKRKLYGRFRCTLYCGTFLPATLAAGLVPIPDSIYSQLFRLAALYLKDEF